jgi:phosphoesterase RecJ-like protein
MTADTSVFSGIGAIRQLLREKDDFVLTGHTNPDGDAVGSCFAMGMALRNAGKRVRVVLERHAQKLHRIPGRDLLCRDSLNELQPGVFMCLDCADANRLGEAKILLEQAKITACVDHHITNHGFTQYRYINGGASSTCELVYQILGADTVDYDIAQALYAGIVTDTDGFRFDSVSSETHLMTAHLISLGIPFTEIYTDLLYQRGLSRTKLLGKILEVCIGRLDGRIIYACVTREMLKSVRATSQELEGIVEYLLNIRGAEVSMLAYEQKSPNVKISLRSRHINVGSVAAKIGGGGHRLAAGADAKGDINDICDHVLRMLEQEMQ